MGKFQSRKPRPLGGVRYPGQGRPRQGVDCGANHCDRVHPGGVDNQPVQPLVRGQQI